MITELERKWGATQRVSGGDSLLDRLDDYVWGLNEAISKALAGSDLRLKPQGSDAANSWMELIAPRKDPKLWRLQLFVNIDVDGAVDGGLIIGLQLYLNDDFEDDLAVLKFNLGQYLELPRSALVQKAVGAFRKHVMKAMLDADLV